MTRAPDELAIHPQDLLLCGRSVVCNLQELATLDQAKLGAIADVHIYLYTSFCICLHFI